MRCIRLPKIKDHFQKVIKHEIELKEHNIIRDLRNAIFVLVYVLSTPRQLAEKYVYIYCKTFAQVNEDKVLRTMILKQTLAIIIL